MGYGDFVLQQSSNVANIESALRSMSYFLPGRFKDSEIVSETLYSGVKLIGLYHDSILEKEAMRQQPQAPTTFNRYTKALLKRIPLYKKVAYCLLAVRSFEIIAEMIALKRYGKKAQEKVIFVVEIVKFEGLTRFVLRLLMMRVSGKRMLMHSEVPERSYDLARLNLHDPDTAQCWTGKRTKKEFLPVDSLVESGGGSEKAVEYLLSRATTQPTADPLQLSTPLGGLREFGEYLYLLRPLLYCIGF